MKEDYAQRYGDLQRWHWWFRGRERIIASVLRRELRAPTPRTILSVGCGPAEGLQWLAPFAGAEGKVIGLDLDLLHAHSLPEGVQFVVGTLEKPPLDNKSFDAILALDVLEHIERDVEGLSEVARLLKPGGLLLITVPALPSLWGGQDLVNEHRRRYTKRSLTRLFDAAGLSGYRVGYFNTFLLPVVAAVRWSRRLGGLSQRSQSDFGNSRPGALNEMLAMVFGAERHLVERASLPIGVSLLAIYTARAGNDLTEHLKKESQS
jgi:SAM-dependent methyltransferase